MKRHHGLTGGMKLLSLKIITKVVGEKMANVKKVGEIYRCAICGNVVEVKEVGGGELVCCGKPMEKIEG